MRTDLVDDDDHTWDFQILSRFGWRKRSSTANIYEKQKAEDTLSNEQKQLIERYEFHWPHFDSQTDSQKVDIMGCDRAWR